MYPSYSIRPSVIEKLYLFIKNDEKKCTNEQKQINQHWSQWSMDAFYNKCTRTFLLNFFRHVLRLVACRFIGCT